MRDLGAREPPPRIPLDPSSGLRMSGFCPAVGKWDSWTLGIAGDGLCKVSLIEVTFAKHIDLKCFGMTSEAIRIQISTPYSSRGIGMTVCKGLMEGIARLLR